MGRQKISLYMITIYFTLFSLFIILIYVIIERITVLIVRYIFIRRILLITLFIFSIRGFSTSDFKIQNNPLILRFIILRLSILYIYNNNISYSNLYENKKKVKYIFKILTNIRTEKNYKNSFNYN